MVQVAWIWGFSAAKYLTSLGHKIGVLAHCWIFHLSAFECGWNLSATAIENAREYEEEYKTQT